MADHEQLLRRFQPYLKYDSLEGFFADSAAEWTDNPSNVLRRKRPDGGGEPDVIASAKDKQLSLAFLGEYDYADGDHIGDLRKDYRTQYVELRKDAGYRNLIYGRTARGRNALWLQYWFWYFFNDYRMAGGIGLHEGDWEMVQLRMPSLDPGPEDEPVVAVYAQHKHAEQAGWEDVEKLQGTDRPVAYVARGSHASYFTSGIHETEVWVDIADGTAEPSELRLDIIPEDPPGWLLWAGRWGDTEPRRRWPANKIDQPSPTGPREHEQWGEPDKLLENSVENRRRDPERPPRLDASNRGGQLVVDFDFSTQVGDEPQKLVVRVNSGDEPDICPRVFTFTLDQVLRGTLETRIELGPGKSYDITLGTIGRDGEPSGSVFRDLGPGPAKDPFIQRVLRRLGRFFYELGR
jgi:hypothetical protein